MKAVVFVDVQKDFIDGALRNEKAIEVTPKIVEFAKSLKAKMEAGTGSFYKFYATRDTHEKTVYDNPAMVLGGQLIPESGYMTTLEGKKLPVEHCIEGTDGWMLDERLAEALDDKVTVVNKPTFGSFDLAEIINEDFNDPKTVEKLEEIIIVGFVTSICVVSNALLLRAKFPNTRITVMKDLCAGLSDDDHEAALKTMRMCQIDVV